MFGRTTINNFDIGDRGPRNTYVTEQRAPTDDSVKLLKEMEAEAKQKIIDSIVVNNTEFECSIVSWHDGLNDKIDYAISYRLNGKKRTFTVPVPNWKRGTPIDVAIKIRDELAKDIASNMIDDVIRHANSRDLFREIV